MSGQAKVQDLWSRFWWPYRIAWRRWKVALGPTSAPEFDYLIKYGRLPDEEER